MREIGIVGYNYLLLSDSVLENLSVGRCRHAELTYVCRVHPNRAQANGRSPREPLVEQQPHAVFARSTTLSSTVVAA